MDRTNLPSVDFDPTRTVNGIVKFLTIVGIWPVEREFRNIYIVYGILFQFTFTFAYTAFNLINLFVVTDVDVMTEQIFIVLPMVSLCIRMTNFVVRFKDVRRFLTEIKAFEVLNHEEYEIYKAKLLLFKYVMIFYFSCSSVAVVTSNCAPLFDSKIRLPFPAWYPIDWRVNTIYYWMLYAYQFIGIFFLSNSLISLENYQIYCMISAATQIEILGHRLKKIGYNDTKSMDSAKQKVCKDEERVTELVKCVKDHKFVMKFVTDIESVFNLPFLFQLFCSSIIFCLTGYQIIITDNAPGKTPTLAYYVCFSITMLNEIFLPCFFGSELTSKNDQLSKEAYSSNWPEQSEQFKKILITFVEHLQRPRIVKSGKIFTLTLFSFLTVINRSYSLFAVLRNVIK